MHWLQYVRWYCLVLMVHLWCGCCGPRCEFEKRLDQPLFTGGGSDGLVVDLPLAQGDTSLCTQGPYGSTSHNARSTRFDVDLDTPNDLDVPVYAPVGGTAYVHDQDPSHGFGIHLNLDQGDDTYVLMGHLKEVFINDASEVAPGQLLGYEGTTGNSFGDHIHLGRHAGDAQLDATQGESFDGLILRMLDQSTPVELATTDMQCALPGGSVYTSMLTVPQWHPDGSLIKTPDSSTIYLLDQRTAYPFESEQAFASRRYNFNDVAVVSEDELACYGVGDALRGLSQIEVIYGAFPNQAIWLLIGQPTDPDRYRLLVADTAWQAVLKTWGFAMATYDDLPHEVEDEGRVNAYPYHGPANFRDGSLVSSIDSGAVYVMSHGLAMPIETWDTYLLLGWEDRQVVELRPEELQAVAGNRGDCARNISCLTRDDVVRCGGPNDASSGATTSTWDQASEDIAEGDELILTWFTPNDDSVDILSLAGAVTHVGDQEEPWGSVFNEVQNDNHIRVRVPDLVQGDEVRVSVQFLNDDVLSWSCLAPFPPGQLQGSFTAEYRGQYLGYSLTRDPVSDGCGLRVVVP